MKIRISPVYFSLFILICGELLNYKAKDLNFYPIVSFRFISRQVHDVTIRCSIVTMSLMFCVAGYLIGIQGVSVTLNCLGNCAEYIDPRTALLLQVFYCTVILVLKLHAATFFCLEFC